MRASHTISTFPEVAFVLETRGTSQFKNQCPCCYRKMTNLLKLEIASYCLQEQDKTSLAALNCEPWGSGLLLHLK